VRSKKPAQAEQKRPESRHRRPRASTPLYNLKHFYSFFGRIFQIYFFSFFFYRSGPVRYESSYRRTAHHATDFALKPVSGLATNGLSSPDFVQNCSKTLYCQKAETTFPVRERSFWQYKVYADIRGGSLGRGRQMRVWSLKMAIFASFVHCLPNILGLHTWPHDSLYVMRLSMTFHIKFLVNGALYGKSDYRVLGLIGNHTPAFDCCHFR